MSGYCIKLQKHAKCQRKGNREEEKNKKTKKKEKGCSGIFNYLIFIIYLFIMHRKLKNIMKNTTGIKETKLFDSN